MFSFIKAIQNLMEKIRGNKRLFFTTLTALGLLGIFIMMYIIMTMTDRVSSEVYANMINDYKLEINNFLKIKEEDLKKIAYALGNNQSIIQIIENSPKQAVKTEDNLTNFFQQNGFRNMEIGIYSAKDTVRVVRNSIISAIQSKGEAFGIEVLDNGVFMVYLLPIVKNDVALGVVEVRENIHSLKDYFERLNKEYAFLLDKKMLVKLNIKAKSGKFRRLIKDLMIEQRFYDTRFVNSLVEMAPEDFDKMIKEGYIIDGVFYRTFKIVSDINGADIGYILVGELLDKEGGFVKIAKNMTNTITIVALGLVVSIILFMF